MVTKKNRSYQITDTEYVFFFNTSNTIERLTEGFVFDTESNELNHVVDFNQHSTPRVPHQFYPTPNNLYFVARTPSDNAYQLFAWERDFVLSTSNQISTSNQTTLLPYPNPSQDFIQLANHHDVIRVKSFYGSRIMELQDYAADRPIDIRSLPKGIYFLEAISVHQKQTATFVKM